MRASSSSPDLRRAAAVFAGFFLSAAALNLLIESMARLDPLGGVLYLLARPLSFLAGTLVLFLSFSLCLLFRRRAFVFAAAVSAWCVLGIANAAVTALRSSPLSGIDFAILRSCLPIVKVYLNGWQTALIVFFLVLFAAAAVFFFLRSRRYEVRWHREGALFLAAVLLTGGGLLLSERAGAVGTGFSDLPSAYEDYGFVTCFSLTVFDRGIAEPEDYSRPMMEALSSSLTETERENPETAAAWARKPNVVIVQLESFMDPERLAGAEYSENPAPVFTELKEKYASGFLRVNAVGAGTANTEFEVLTGIDLGLFGAGEYPYQTVLLEEGAACESMASDARSAGYAACAVHNHSASFYDRNRVYEALGFDCFVPLEAMNGVEKNPLGWAKDAILTDIVAERMEQTEEPDLCFVVSVQGHGLYPDTPIPETGLSGEEGTDPIRVLSLPEAAFSSGGTHAREEGARLARFYGLEDGSDPASFDSLASPDETARNTARLAYCVNQIRETDAFVGELVSTLTERAERTGEPTVLLLYGDHLPAFPFGAESFADGSDEFDSEYILVPIGFDFTADEDPGFSPAADRDCEAWEIGMRALTLAGIDEGKINLCHRLAAWNGEDDAPDSHEKGTAKRDRALGLLAYDLLYGSRYAWGGEAPFRRGTLAVGLLPARIGSVALSSESGGDGLFGERECLAVHGEGFTPYSVLTVNGRPKKTVFVSPAQLRAEVRPADGDRIAVILRTEDFVTLSETPAVVFREER